MELRNFWDAGESDRDTMNPCHSLRTTPSGNLYCEVCMLLWVEIQRLGNLKCGGKKS